MMLTSVDHQTDGARCRRLSFAAYLVKPVKSRRAQGIAVRSASRAPKRNSPLRLRAR